MPRFTGVNHLAMVTGDMEATIRFWRDLLGCRLVAGLGRPGQRHYFFEISERDLLAFFEWPGISAVPEKDHGLPVKGAVIFDHVSFGVDSEEELWRLRDRLLAAGFPASEVIDHGFIRSIYSFDPNGLAIEFSADIEEVDVRRHPVMADVSPTPAALEGAEARPEVWPPVTRPTPPGERRVHAGVGAGKFEAARVAAAPSRDGAQASKRREVSSEGLSSGGRSE